MSGTVHSQEGNTNVEASAHTDLGLRLREAREYLGLSQEFVASCLSIPRASVSAMETGKRRVSSLELKSLAKLYKRPISFFLGDADQELEADETANALFRAARGLTPEDRRQVLQFAEFLRQAGRAAEGPQVPAAQNQAGEGES